MFEGYELMDCEEMMQKYQDKALDNSEPLLAQDKKNNKQCTVLFKHTDRLNFRVNNLYYGKA